MNEIDSLIRLLKETDWPVKIAKYDVTQAEWKRVMRKNPSYTKRDNPPVEQVSWDKCKEFGEKTGVSHLFYGHNGSDSPPRWLHGPPNAAHSHLQRHNGIPTDVESSVFPSVPPESKHSTITLCMTTSYAESR